MYQNPPTLRYDPTRLTQPFLNFTLDYPPYIPNIPAPGPLAPYLPLISAMCALEIQQRAQSNALRTFMFNKYAQNNFATPDFDALVDACLQYIDLKMVKRMYGHVEEAIRDCVPEMVEMICAMALTDNPGLENYTDPNTQAGAHRIIQAFQNIAHEIGQRKRSGMVQQQAPIQTQGYGNAYGGPAPQVQVHRSGTYGGFSTVSAVQSTTTSSPLFSSTTQSGDAPSGAEVASRYDSKRYQLPQQAGNDRAMAPTPSPATLSQPFNARVANIQQEQPAMQHTQEKVIDPTVAPAAPTLIPYKDLKYSGSLTFPYFPAFHPSQHTLFYQVEPNGSTIPKFKERATAVDYDKHALTNTVFGTAPKKLDMVDHLEMLSRVQKGVRVMRDETAKPGEIETPMGASGLERDPGTTYVMDKWISASSIDSAWVQGQLERVKWNLAAKELPGIFRVYAEVLTPTVAEVDESELVKTLNAAKSFTELAALINQNLNTMSPALYGVINRRMTETLNRILAQNISLPNVSIDSFVDDIGELLDYVEEKFGSVVKDAVVRHQREHIASAIAVAPDDLAKSITENLMDRFDFEEGKAPKVTFVSSSYSLTYLNVISHALDLELNDQGASAVLKQMTPMFYDMLTTLFEEVEKQPDFVNFDRHLIMTLDGRVLEATKGYMGEAAGQKFYLLTLVE